MPATKVENHLTLACILPFVVYLTGSAWLSKLPTDWYWVGYTLVATTSAVLAWTLLGSVGRLNFLRPHRHILPGLIVGVLGILLWIALSHLQLERWLAPAWLQPAARVGFNPFEQLGSATLIALFLIVRIVGIAVVVPVIEELFWRGFLLRWTIDPDWRNVPIGTFSWKSCWIVTALFTAAHPEWFAAAAYSLLINGLLYWKKDIWQCIVAHAVSNLLLVAYVLFTGNWWLW